MDNDLKPIIDLISSGDYETAERDLSLLVRADPQNLDAWMLLGQISHDPSRKMACYRQILRIDPDNQRAAVRMQVLMENTASPGGLETKKNGNDILCPQCSAVMQIKHIGQKKAPRAVCAFCGTQLDLPDTFKRESDLAQDPGFSSSPQTDGITDQIHRDGHLEVEDSASIPPEVQDLVVILKNKGFKGIDTDFLQKLLSSGISLTVDQENSDPDMLTGSQQIHSDPPGDSHSSSSKMIPFESERSDTGMLVGLLNRLGIAGPKPPPVGRLDLSALMKTALPPDQSQKCPNKTCGAMIPKDAKRCPWCGREF